MFVCIYVVENANAIIADMVAGLERVFVISRDFVCLKSVFTSLLCIVIVDGRKRFSLLELINLEI